MLGNFAFCSIKCNLNIINFRIFLAFDLLNETYSISALEKYQEIYSMVWERLLVPLVGVLPIVDQFWLHSNNYFAGL
jgi:hypothetical protein